jgi:thioredoxin-like negative regulator of GroEL
MIAPLLDEIAGEQSGRVKIAKVNVDENLALAARYSIQSIPTLLYFAKGVLRGTTVGGVAKKKILYNLQALTLTEYAGLWRSQIKAQPLVS